MARRTVITVLTLALVGRIRFYARYASHQDLHSFPTRRSSDLGPTAARGAARTERPPADSPGRAGRADPHARRAGGTRWPRRDRKSTRLNSSHPSISYAVFCLKKKIGGRRCDVLRASVTALVCG